MIGTEFSALRFGRVTTVHTTVFKEINDEAVENSVKLEDFGFGQFRPTGIANDLHPRGLTAFLTCLSLD